VRGKLPCGSFNLKTNLKTNLKSKEEASISKSILQRDITHKYTSLRLEPSPISFDNVGKLPRNKQYPLCQDEPDSDEKIGGW
jgi:hypothetical protein